jgi:alginate O-acetyltransferase complex protein AlgI
MFDRSAEYKNLILCITSLLFVVWGRAFAAAAIFLSVIVDFILALAAEGATNKHGKKNAAVFMILDLLMNAGIFVVLTHNSLFSASSTFHLRSALIPVGVAFYTLKNFSYVYDVYSGRIKAERNIFCLITYAVSYPFLLAGPVVRYGDIEPQLRNRTVNPDCLNSGLTRFAIGLAKTVIAVPVLNTLSETALDSSSITLANSWIGIAAFFAAAYFTLMGLSDMGTGTARMNGFDVDVNYKPISSKHMLGGLVKSYNTSMVTFCSDICGNGKISAPILTVIVGLIAAAYYAQHKFVLVFGLIIAILLAAERIIGYEKIEKIPSVLKFAATAILAVLLFSCMAFDSYGDWKIQIASMLGKGVKKAWTADVKHMVINNCWLLAIAFISISPFGRLITKLFDRLGEKSPQAYGRVRILKTFCTALLLIAAFILLAARTAEV